MRSPPLQRRRLEMGHILGEELQGHSESQPPPHPSPVSRSSHCAPAAARQFEGCTRLTTPPALTGLTALEELHLDDCTSLMTPPTLTGLTALHTLSLIGCPIPDPPDLPAGVHVLR